MVLGTVQVYLRKHKIIKLLSKTIRIKAILLQKQTHFFIKKMHNFISKVQHVDRYMCINFTSKKMALKYGLRLIIELE